MAAPAIATKREVTLPMRDVTKYHAYFETDPWPSVTIDESVRLSVSRVAWEALGKPLLLKVSVEPVEPVEGP